MNENVEIQTGSEQAATSLCRPLTSETLRLTCGLRWRLTAAGVGVERWRRRDFGEAAQRLGETLLWLTDLRANLLVDQEIWRWGFFVGRSRDLSGVWKKKQNHCSLLSMLIWAYSPFKQSVTYRTWRRGSPPAQCCWAATRTRPDRPDHQGCSWTSPGHGPGQLPASGSSCSLSRKHLWRLSHRATTGSSPSHRSAGEPASCEVAACAGKPWRKNECSDTCVGLRSFGMFRGFWTLFFVILRNLCLFAQKRWTKWHKTTSKWNKEIQKELKNESPNKKPQTQQSGLKCRKWPKATRVWKHFLREWPQPDKNNHNVIWNNRKWPNLSAAARSVWLHTKK